MDESNYTTSATGVGDKVRNQVESVAALMEANTNRLGLSSARIDSYAKWFVAVVTLIVGVSGIAVKSYSDRIISEKNDEISEMKEDLEELKNQLEYLLSKNKTLEAQIVSLRTVIRGNGSENPKVLNDLFEQFDRISETDNYQSMRNEILRDKLINQALNDVLNKNKEDANED